MSPALAIPLAIIAIPLAFGLFVAVIVLVDELSDYLLGVGLVGLFVALTAGIAWAFITGAHGDPPTWVWITGGSACLCALAGAMGIS